MARLHEDIERLARTTTTVLITGENGTGKELVAHQVWLRSPRHARPLIRLNCAALPHDLVESELFGFRKGAFTGADRNRAGKFLAADGGTIFLDEIAELPLAIQAKLLRVIESGEIEPLGADTPEQVDVRIVTATNRDLQRLLAEGKFRADLFYRLNVVPLQVPPLRERREDIPLLIHHFAVQLAQTTGLGEKRLSPEAVGLLSGLDWPGNVRELRNFVERCYIMTRGALINVDDVHAQVGVPPTAPPRAEAPNSLTQAVINFEKTFLAGELQKHGGNIAELARALGVDRGNLSKKLRGYGIV